MKASLPAYEQDVLDRLESGGNTVGWRPWGRRKDGVALLRVDQPDRCDPRMVRVSLCALTPEGMSHYQPVSVPADVAKRLKAVDVN